MPTELAVAEFSLVDPTQTHHQSTLALLGLLSTAVSQCQASLRWSSTHVFGDVFFAVSSNDIDSANFLTRCLLPAGEHEQQAPALDIHILTGSSHPFTSPPPWNLPHTDQRHLERLHLSPDGMVSAFYDHDRQFWMMLDKVSRRALLWIAKADDMPFWEGAAPFKQILQWWLTDTHMTMLHGGVVTNSHSGLLLAGPGGSGKSTTVAACLQAGLGVCGDDLIVTERRDGNWTAHAVYDSVKLAPNQSIPAPPVLHSAPWSSCGEKRLVRYSDAAPERFIRSTSLNALLHCVVAGSAASKLVPVPPSTMLRAIGPPTAFLLRGRESHILKEVNSLVRGLPCFRLELGINPAEAAALLSDTLESMSHD